MAFAMTFRVFSFFKNYFLKSIILNFLIEILKKVYPVTCFLLNLFWSILSVSHIVNPTLQIHVGDATGKRLLLNSEQLVPGFS